MDIYTVTIPPVEQPILLSNAKAWLRITDNASDAILEDIIIPAAVEVIEKYLNRYLIERTVEGQFDAVQQSPNYEVKPFLELRRSPLISTESVEGEVGGTTVALTFQEKKSCSFSRILLDSSELTSFDDTPFPLKVTFRAGYGLTADIPKDIIQALYSLVAFMYSNRGECASGCDGSQFVGGMPSAIASKIASYRIVATF